MPQLGVQYWVYRIENHKNPTPRSKDGKCSVMAAPPDGMRFFAVWVSSINVPIGFGGPGIVSLALWPINLPAKCCWSCTFGRENAIQHIYISYIYMYIYIYIYLYIYIHMYRHLHSNSFVDMEMFTKNRLTCAFFSQKGGESSWPSQLLLQNPMVDTRWEDGYHKKHVQTNQDHSNLVIWWINVDNMCIFVS